MKAVRALAIACMRQRRLVDITEHSQGTHEACDAAAKAWEREGRGRAEVMGPKST